MGLDIVVPVYNEVANIAACLYAIDSQISVPKRVIIVYDRENDTTLPVVREVGPRFSFEIVLQQNLYGNGALQAIKTGFAVSHQEAVLVVMADLSDDLSCTDEMYRRIVAGFDVVCGSRYMKGGRQLGGPLLKRLLSRLAGVSLFFLVGIPTHDVTNSFKMYSRRLLTNIAIESEGGFELGMELSVKGFVRGFRVTEVPTTWHDRTDGSSRFRLFAWLPHYLRWYAYALSKAGLSPLNQEHIDA